ncbi:MAG: hypothetical protein KGZ92_05675 [Firmicutes bacterium]|nr:hypothetical protein [Dethiobacter sp.]MBS3888777.1 hypothetical protein [Bacillota bacterium]MBS4053898.1 hypothetical protein [Thermaerobacter sp.]
MTIGQTVAWVDDQAHSLGSPPARWWQNGGAFRFIFEKLGYNVEWVESDHVIKVGK